jgi:hypothetical protein
LVGGILWVEQLYTTRRDVQMKRAGIFFATLFSFHNALRGTCGIVSETAPTSRKRRAHDCSECAALDDLAASYEYAIHS